MNNPILNRIYQVRDMKRGNGIVRQTVARLWFQGNRHTMQVLA